MEPLFSAILRNTLNGFINYLILELIFSIFKFNLIEKSKYFPACSNVTHYLNIYFPNEALSYNRLPQNPLSLLR